MRKIILGVVAAATIASPLAIAGTASATTATAAECTPSAASVVKVQHTEYQWAALVAKPTLHWDYKWTTSTKNPTTDLKHIWVKSLDLTKKGTPQITRTVVDTDAKAAVTCDVTLAEHFEGEGTYSVVVPRVKGVDTFLYGVAGYDERTAITADTTVTIAMAGQFWVGYKAQPGYVIANPTTAQWHIDFGFVPGMDSVVRLSDQSGKHLELPDTFGIQHTEFSEGDYWSTQVKVLVVNDTDTDREFRVRYQDVQDGERVWVERAIFTDGQPGNVVAARSSRVMVFDVWHNAVSDENVPDDLTLDFGFELA